MNKSISNSKRKGISLLLFFIFLFFISLVGAIPPVTNFYFENGLTIVSSPQIYLQQSQDFQINFFVYNQSNGAVMDNSTINCTYYLADNFGEVLYFSDVPYLPDGYWGLNLTGGNFSELVEYNYGIKCEGAGQGGTTVGVFYVTPTGLGSNLGFYIIVLILSLGIIIFGVVRNDSVVGLLGSFGLYFLGMYILFNGIVGVKDLVTTWAIGLILLGLAVYVSIKSAYGLITD